MDKKRILILGGTAEARDLAGILASRNAFDIVLSLAGRTIDPAPQPVPTRIGGFGGAEGLADFLRGEAIDLLIDATHPYATRISRNAGRAASTTGLPLIRLERSGWQAADGDRWTGVSSIAEAVTTLGDSPRRVFLAIGRQEAFHFNAAPRHHYLVRSIDPVVPPLEVPSADYILARGPFTVADEVALLTRHRIDIVVSKNSGADATYAKIEAARSLGLPVIMVDRIADDGVPTAQSIDGVMDLIDHVFPGSRKRGV